MDKEKTSRFLDKEIQNPGIYGIYHYISESFYAILLNTNSLLLDIYSTWYNISKNSISANHPLTRSKPLQHFDERAIRLFYCCHGLGKMDAKFMITPRTEVALYIQNKKILTTKKFFFSAKIREFEKIFPKEKELIEYEGQKKKLKIWRKKKITV